jgi:predicted transcriptional regulator
VGHDLRNVQQDLRLLENYGLVKFGRQHGRTGRSRKAPEALFDEIALRIAIRARVGSEGGAWLTRIW